MLREDFIMKIKRDFLCMAVTGVMALSVFFGAENTIDQSEVYAKDTVANQIYAGEAVHVEEGFGKYYLEVEEKCEYMICAYNANQCDTFLKLFEGENLIETADDSDGRYGKYGNFLLNIELEPGKVYCLEVRDDNESGTAFVFSVVKKGASLPEYDGKVAQGYTPEERETENNSTTFNSNTENATTKKIEISTNFKENVNNKDIPEKAKAKIQKKINLKATKITGVKINKKKIIIKYKKVKNASGYMIQWSETKTFAKCGYALNKGLKTVVKYKNKSVRYVRVRAFYLGEDVAVLGKWSKPVKVR